MQSSQLLAFSAKTTGYTGIFQMAWAAGLQEHPERMSECPQTRALWGKTLCKGTILERHVPAALLKQ